MSELNKKVIDLLNGLTAEQLQILEKNLKASGDILTLPAISNTDNISNYFQYIANGSGSGNLDLKLQFNWEDDLKSFYAIDYSYNPNTTTTINAIYPFPDLQEAINYAQLNFTNGKLVYTSNAGYGGSITLPDGLDAVCENYSIASLTFQAGSSFGSVFKYIGVLNPADTNAVICENQNNNGVLLKASGIVAQGTGLAIGITSQSMTDFSFEITEISGICDFNNAAGEIYVERRNCFGYGEPIYRNCGNVSGSFGEMSFAYHNENVPMVAITGSTDWEISNLYVVRLDKDTACLQGYVESNVNTNISDIAEFPEGFKPFQGFDLHSVVGQVGGVQSYDLSIFGSLNVGNYGVISAGSTEFSIGDKIIINIPYRLDPNQEALDMGYENKAIYKKNNFVNKIKLKHKFMRTQK